MYVSSTPAASFYTLTRSQGLEDYEQSLKYWKKAVDAFPKENLTSTEMRQKEQCIVELQKAVRTVAQMDDLIMLTGDVQGKMPWDRAKALERHLEATLPDSQESSVSDIHYGPDSLAYSNAILTCRHGLYCEPQRCVMDKCPYSHRDAHEYAAMGPKDGRNENNWSTVKLR